MARAPRASSCTMWRNRSVTSEKVRLALLPVFAMAGALLMFVLEPLVGRILLPAYGGSFQVWSTCMMFFQGIVLLGYLYAHFVGPRVGRWHLVVAALPLAFLPIDVVGHPQAGDPVFSILWALIAHVAVPMAVLSTTAVMAQTWLATASDGRLSDPYWLYAASNAGSLFGLLAYPLLAEPLAGVRSQRLAWSAAYVGYLVLAALVAPAEACPASTRRRAAVLSHADQGADKPALWLALSTAPSIMLMAVTNALSFDVGSVPLVWVAPLALYLTTFILVFRKHQLYPPLLRAYWLELAVAGLVVLVAAPLFSSWWRIALHLLALFAVAMAAHGELHRLRPPSHTLTKYYLVISVGGWLGGVFVCLVAPVLFSRLLEYPIAVVMVAGALAWAQRSRGARQAPAGVPRLRAAVHAPAVVTGIALAGVWLVPALGTNPTRLMLLRDHYGLYQVGDLPTEVSIDGKTRVVNVRQIIHNGTMHGSQVVAGDLRHDPIAYYHRAGGLGDVMSIVGSPFKLAAIGLGAGTSTAYVGRDDEITYYEIDPTDERLARQWFTYLDDCPGKSRVVIGDARLTLAADAQAPDGTFDALLIDAFSGDAIPTHLLTTEAIELYRRKVKHGGILAFHITNRFYDLRTVLDSARRSLGMHGAYKTRDAADGLEPFESRTRYWVMTDDVTVIDHLVDLGWTRAEDATALAAPVRAWTDDYTNVLAPLWAELRDPPTS